MVNELTIWQRGCAAGIASLVSSVFLNPIDVVKVRRMPSDGGSMLHSPKPRRIAVAIILSIFK